MTNKQRPIADMKEVLERARRLDASAVNENWSAGIGDQSGDSSVVEFLAPDEAPPAELAAFLDGVRTHLNARAEQRALERIPPPPAELEARHSLGWIFGVAAAISISIGAGAWGLSVAAGSAEQAQATQAELTAAEEKSEHARSRARLVTPQESSQLSNPPQISAPVETSPVIAPSDEEADTAHTDAPPKVPRATNEPAKKKTADRDLEVLAQAAWATGDLAGAESLLRQLIRRTRSRSRREQAYGDLLSLVEQRGNSSRTTKLWRDYLRRYPTGRYSDDLQARLCRKQAKSGCWDEYLKKHPKGAHRQEAESATRN